MQKIDFVLPWVDGGDTAWNELKRSYLNSDSSSTDLDATADWRYRDYGLLKYWFRAVERFAPWVNRVFFITCGQKPDWLNESSPKLRLVNHSDYIPPDYLPTFQSNTIELNLHRIADLSEQFVLFNDDTFLLRPVEPEFFFRKGRPVIPCDLGLPFWLNYNHISRVAFNNFVVLRRNIDVKHTGWKNIRNFIDVYHLGLSRAVKNFLVFAVNRTVFLGNFGHLPQSHLKSTIDEIWHAEHDIMDKTSRSRFRCDDCVNQWLACAWNMVSGRSCPANEKKRGREIFIQKSNLPLLHDAIRKSLYPFLCLGDNAEFSELEQCLAEIYTDFETVLQEKSSFEK